MQGPGSHISTVVKAAAATREPGDVLDALMSVHPDELTTFFHAVRVEAHDVAPAAATGTPASAGIASGRMVLSAEAAIAAEDPVILVRSHTTPEDVTGMLHSAGIVTARGGHASHAAVVARGRGIPAVVGAEQVRISDEKVLVGAVECSEGDVLTIDGATGEIFVGAAETRLTPPPPELETFLSWADAVRAGRLRVRVNADNADDALAGRRFGAEGIGLCRTEHMFLEPSRLPAMRRFILAKDSEAEEAALVELETMQTADFESLLEAVDGLPVTVRLLDPPLHEFLPDVVELVERHAAGLLDEAGADELAAVRRLHELNPMIGTRGVRLGLIREGLYQMQVRALCSAVVRLLDRGVGCHVELMIPLVVDAEELRVARGLIEETLDEIGHPELARGIVTIGAMIETPRAALTAADLASHADFFSIGTNDLTQLTYGFSRDDVEARLLPNYLQRGILASNPFAVVDPLGVGELVSLACARARSAKPGIEIGVCGEHAGNVESVAVLLGAGVSYLSCSPFRVPMARLAAAQALIAAGSVGPEDIQFEFPTVDHGQASDRRASEQLLVSETVVVDRPAEGLDELLVLHVMRVRGVVAVEGLAESLGADGTHVVDSLVTAGDVRHIEARGLFMLSPQGRARHESLLEASLDDDLISGLAGAYRDFLDLNADLKQACTAWQMRGDVPNDHTDADYDRACLEELRRIGHEIEPILDALAGVLQRFERYKPRLRAPLDRALAGDGASFTGGGCGSFHDVWMELHEDLMVLLGVDREVEGSF
jgi:phosphoenolpyruvate-protein kinase (PTS system EI component)